MRPKNHNRPAGNGLLVNGTSRLGSAFFKAKPTKGDASNLATDRTWKDLPPGVTVVEISRDRLRVEVPNSHVLENIVRDNNIDQALKALKKLQRERSFREMKLSGHYEKQVRKSAQAVRNARKLARKKIQREDLLPMVPTIERGPITNFSAEADRLGVPLGPTNDPKQAEDIIRRVAEDALDLFGSTEAGVAYLSSKDIDGLGHTGLNLVAERGLSAVLMKLDELRFGFAG